MLGDHIIDPPGPDPIDPINPDPIDPEPEPPPDAPDVFITIGNRNPNPSTICNACKQIIGRTFLAGTEPRLPMHAGCFCYYIVSDHPPPPVPPPLPPPMN
jgi:hypothetical protein